MLLLEQFKQCFLDGQIPCRYPLSLNTAPPLPFYLSLLLKLLGLSDTLSFLIAILFIFISLFFLYKNKFIFLPILSIYLLLSLPYYLSIITIPLLLIVAYFNKKLVSAILAVLLSTFYLIPAFVHRADLISRPSLTQPIVLQKSSAVISEFRYRSNFWRFTINVPENNVDVLVPFNYLPNWKIFIDQQSITPNVQDKNQPVKLTIPQGRHTLAAFLESTLLETIANAISLAAFCFLFIYTLPTNAKKNN